MGVGEVLGLVDADEEGVGDGAGDGEDEGDVEGDGEGEGDGDGEGDGLGFGEGKLRLGTAWEFAELRIGMKVTLPKLKLFL